MKNRLENIDNLWTFETPKSLLLTWDKLPFETKTSINWRGIIIHISINAHQIEFGTTRTIIFLHNEKFYHCKLTKWKYSGGGNGIYPPEVSTSTHKLKIRTGLNYLSINDELIIPSSKVHVEEIPFEIIKTPDNIVFDSHRDF